MNVYVYPTDRDWYQFLSMRPGIDEVNFWRPGGRMAFKQLKPGDLFLFRLGAPDNAIAGGGTFTHFSFAPLMQSWEAFGIKNGTPDFSTFARLVARYKDIDPNSTDVSWATIGNIILTLPFFLAPSERFAIPADYQVNSPQGQRFDASHGSGKVLYDAVHDMFSVRRVAEPGIERVEFGESVVRRRLGQGAFSMLVVDAYGRRCAVSGEKTVPVLEAAHIKPVAAGGIHSAANGLLLRSDIHKLFDRGYVTVDPRGDFRVSSRLRTDWQNGVIYYAFDRKPVSVPENVDLRPSQALLEWHNDTVFLG